MDGQVGAGEGDAGVGEGRRDVGRRSAGEGEWRVVDRLESRCRRGRAERCTGSRRRRRRRWHRWWRQSRGKRHACRLKRRGYCWGSRCWQWQHHVPEGHGLRQSLSTGGDAWRGKYGVGFGWLGLGLGLGLGHAFTGRLYHDFLVK